MIEKRKAEIRENYGLTSEEVARAIEFHQGGWRALKAASMDYDATPWWRFSKKDQARRALMRRYAHYCKVLWREKTGAK